MTRKHAIQFIAGKLREKAVAANRLPVAVEELCSEYPWVGAAADEGGWDWKRFVRDVARFYGSVASSLPPADKCGLAREAAKTDIDRERAAAGLPRLLTEAEYAAAATDPRRHGFRPGSARGCCGLCGQPDHEHDDDEPDARGQ